RVDDAIFREARAGELGKYRRAAGDFHELLNPADARDERMIPLTRTVCIATRWAGSLMVVSRPPTWTSSRAAARAPSRRCLFRWTTRASSFEGLRVQGTREACRCLDHAGTGHDEFFAAKHVDAFASHRRNRSERVPLAQVG